MNIQSKGLQKMSGKGTKISARLINFISIQTLDGTSSKAGLN